ncbi:hypothetical protein AB0425_30590 [Actinosynnema sp. NPDC051121]
MTTAGQPEPLADQDDPVDPDEIAEQAPIDPTPQEVDEYRSLIGDETPERDETTEVERTERKDVVIPEF